jgi:hypothetical protein
MVQLLFGIANLAQDVAQLGQVVKPQAVEQRQKVVNEL